MSAYEQIELSSIHTVQQPDEELQLFNKIKELIELKYKDYKSLSFKTNKSYSTICFFEVPKLRIRKVKNVASLEIPEHFKDEITKYSVSSKLMSDRYFRIFEPFNIKFVALLTEIYEYCFRKYSDDRFDCCSRYMLCSELKSCCNKDEKLARACSYRYKIKSGVIFYGPNRTAKQ